jgi:uncharacterized protein (TIGR03083 family)
MRTAYDPPVDGVGMYRSGRERLLALGRGLTDEQASLLVAATPEWTVKDNFAHMAGVADDLLAGRVEGATTDPWTEAQVAARRAVPLEAILDELEGYGPAMDELVGALGDAIDVRLFLDQWTHEQDVRGTVGVAGGADAPVVAWGAEIAAGTWVRRAAKRGLPLRVHIGELECSTDDDAGVAVAVDAFTALRVLTGRRSAGQLAALDWSGTDDPSPWFPALVAFSVADRDIFDAR